MRGVVAVAFATPQSMAARDLVLFLAFTTLGSLLLHGSTLGPLIRLLRVRSDEDRADADSEAQVRGRPRGARTQVASSEETTPGQMADLLRPLADHRTDTAREWIEDEHGDPAGRSSGC